MQEDFKNFIEETVMTSEDIDPIQSVIKHQTSGTKVSEYDDVKIPVITSGGSSLRYKRNSSSKSKTNVPLSKMRHITNSAVNIVNNSLDHE